MIRNSSYNYIVITSPRVEFNSKGRQNGLLVGAAKSSPTSGEVD